MPGLAATQAHDGATVSATVELARVAERLGYESFWLSQRPDARDSVVLLAACAAKTDRIGLATAVLPIATHHPAAMTQMAATLDELSGGRFRLGLGVGHKIGEVLWGVRFASPLGAVREYVTIVRRGLSEGKVDLEGTYFTARWSYSGSRRPQFPILLGAVNHRMLELAGEIADGVVLFMCSPGYVRDHVIPHVRAGRQRTGRSLEGFEVVAMVPSSVTADIAAGREMLRRIVTLYAGVPAYRRMLEASGFAADLARGRVSDEMLARLGGIGDETAVRAIVRRYREAGCTLPMVAPFAGHKGAAGQEATLQAAAST